MQRRDERGNALIIALFIVLFISLVMGALVGYTNTSQTTSSAYRDVRDERYSGDSAIEAAINWAADNPNVAVDPALTATPDPCVFRVTTEVGPVSVTCDAEEGSGEPAEGGMLPPEALLLLGKRVDWTGSGTRDETTGPYNAPLCKGWWDTFSGWFSTGVEPNANDGYKEYSALFKPRVGLGTLNTSCNDEHERGWDPFVVQDGDVIAAGRMVGYGASGGFDVLDGSLKARRGCTGGNMTCSLPGTRTTGENVPAALNGTPEDSDPARPYPIPANDPTPTDTRNEWLPVGFGSNGTLAPGYSTSTNYPVRTTAYKMNEDGSYSTISGCPMDVTQTIVFLPGWYKDANVLNQYTANGSCSDRTIWLAPDPGADNLLLTDDDVTGSYYMDFRFTSSASTCGQTPSNGAMAASSKSRWCIGATAIQNPRVVTGTPTDWNPAGVYDSASTKTVTLSSAGTVDDDLSQVWSSVNEPMRIGDGQVANYSPLSGVLCFFNIFNFGTCPSIDRSIRLRDFSPNVSGPPVDGKINVSAVLGVQNGSGIGARVEVRAVSNESGQVNCGTFDLGTPPAWNGNLGSAPAPVSLSAADQTTLATNCGQVDRINGFELRFLFEGNSWNVGDPQVWLDGAEITFNAQPGAAFPAPISGSDQTAQSDCDTTKPGAQLIFGGESHVFVADGSLEVCAGAYPQNPEDHQVVGVHGVPAVDPVRPTGITNWGNNNGGSSPLNTGNITEIDSKEVTIRYGGCGGFCFIDYEEGWVDVAMETYSPPAGYAVSKIEARVSYNPKNSGCSFLWDCPGRAPQMTVNGCDIDYPKNPDRGPLQVANWNNAVLYDAAPGSDCMTPNDLANGETIRWKARAECTAGVCKVGGGQYADTIDGIELMVTLAPTDTSKPYLIPQSGCIVAYPNYNGGEGAPDCAILKSSTALLNDNYAWPWQTFEAQSKGRFAVRGTIYAPSAALDIDDGDAAYSLASRGAILRHLRVSGYDTRSDDPAILYDVDRTPAPREATFTACRRASGNETAEDPCGSLAGDVVLTRAKVRFEIDSTSSVPQEDKARVPKVVWWSADV